MSVLIPRHGTAVYTIKLRHVGSCGESGLERLRIGGVSVRMTVQTSDQDAAINRSECWQDESDASGFNATSQQMRREVEKEEWRGRERD